ncbi:FAD-binding oxidoreductase [Limnochorda pilosa]|uniref:FAD-binding PCMH-type domain-containing protein n=1 Tax=Limnochorda pilosa TaxID=1555112 RepID=A0A0K2SGJ4_LIMPI|nr:FAD-binding oxidoreductase [Limnochorda pilosa]BAS25969.1 hypothetical protein LIP_0112 [Limnochorda pilosa]
MHWRERLQALFGERAQFQGDVLSEHGRDGGASAGFGPFLHTRPSAVVWPESAGEVIELVRIAAEAGVPLVPRGGATSPWGGALPVRGGIAVNFSRMARVLEVDPTTQTVTVEPGVTWNRVEEALLAHSLALRLLPTSAPRSTVGGWVAEDGAGLGSYQYGYLHSNLQSVEMVTATGETLRSAGNDLRLVCGLEGITGLITRVTLKVAREAPLSVWALAYLSQAELIRALHLVFDSDWPLWHVAFRNAEASNEAPVGANRHGFADDMGILVLMSRDPDRHALDAQVDALARFTGGRVLAPHQAVAEWDDRFAAMESSLVIPGALQRRLVLPRYGLTPLVEDLAELQHPVALQGVGVMGEEVAVHAFAPSFLSRRQAERALATLEERVGRYGGHPYSIGLLRAHEAARILGPRQMRELIAWKKRYDPRHLLNPGKVLPSPGISWRVRAALAWSHVVGTPGPAAVPSRPEGERVRPETRVS